MNYANMKIYFDGGHYVGIPQGAFPSGKGCKRRAVRPMNQQSTADVTRRPTPRKNALKRHIKRANLYPSENARLI